jgi:hypothetical protein
MVEIGDERAINKNSQRELKEGEGKENKILRRGIG